MVIPGRTPVQNSGDKSYSPVNSLIVMSSGYHQEEYIVIKIMTINSLSHQLYD